MINGTYICDKHNNINQWAGEAARLVGSVLDGTGGTEELEQTLELLVDVQTEVLAAKRDGQRMENRLVERAVQGDALTNLADGLSDLAKRITQYLPQ